jgi:hypothetical protein
MTTAKGKWDRFDARWTPEPNTGCWIWIGTLDKYGYGRYSRFHPRLAHRQSWIREHGDVPDGKHLDHLCRVRCCVNPAHLEPVTCRENLMRGKTLAAENSRKTHCAKGHAFSTENTLLIRGRRRCRACQSAANIKCLRALYARRKAMGLKWWETSKASRKAIAASNEPTP